MGDMGDFFRRCKANACRALDNSFAANAANIALIIVALLLLISLLITPGILVALALLGLFICALLCC